jgi:hypothetical protein
MNPLDDSLRRLFRAAARAPAPAPPALPAPLRAEILRRWRSTSVEDEFAFLIGMFQRAAIYASFIMALSVTWHYLADQNAAAGPVPLAQYAMTLQMPP